MATPVVKIGDADISPCVHAIVLEAGISSPKLTLDLELATAPDLPNIASRPVMIEIKYPLGAGHFSTVMQGALISSVIDSENHPTLTLVFDVTIS